MQARDYRLYLDDMLEAIGRIRRHVGAMDFIAFKTDEKTVDAVIRNLEVIGEAARNVPEPLRQSCPEAEWRKIVALRNILIHDYFGVNLEIIWDIVQHKLDDLESTCRNLLEAGPLAGDQSLAETGLQEAKQKGAKCDRTN